jgi:hypothetical protein
MPATALPGSRPPARPQPHDPHDTAPGSPSLEARTPLTLISDAAYQAGLARLRAAATTDARPVIDGLDLLVLHKAAP